MNDYTYDVSKAMNIISKSKIANNFKWIFCGTYIQAMSEEYDYYDLDSIEKLSEQLVLMIDLSEDKDLYYEIYSKDTNYIFSAEDLRVLAGLIDELKETIFKRGN